jgi:hypothetical protein
MILAQHALDTLCIGGLTMSRSPLARLPETDFVNLTLPQSEESNFTGWAKKNEKQWPAMVTTLIEQGYRVSLSPDFENACIIVTLTCRSADSPNNGKAMSTRAEHWIDALLLALYKHLVFTAGNWGEVQPRRRSWG